MKENCNARTSKPCSVKSGKYTGKNILFRFNIFIIVIAIFTTVALMQSVQINRLLAGVKTAGDNVSELCTELETMSNHYSYYSDNLPVFEPVRMD